MKWTYDKVQEWIQRSRKLASRRGCGECGRIVLALELAGTPSIGQLVRAGRGVNRIRIEVRKRGWFCRKCARSGGKKKQQQQCPESVLDKRAWGDDKKWDYVFASPVIEIRGARVREVFEGADREAALKILYSTT